jgi:excinuclease ABC subunit A
MGNTVIVVEHDEQTMRMADEIVDFGPGPGVRGGEVVAQGNMEAIMRSPPSITGKFLRGDDQIDVPAARRPVTLSRTPTPSIGRRTAKTDDRNRMTRRKRT